MKAIILAADGPSSTQGKYPRSMTLWENRKPVLSLLLSYLGYVGLAPDSICIVIGAGGFWDSAERKDLRFLEPYRVIRNPASRTTGSFDSLMLALSSMQLPENLLVVNGDLVPNLNTLRRVSGFQGQDVVFGRPPFWMGEKGLPIAFSREESSVVEVGEGARGRWPWALYAGMLCVSASTIEKLREKKAESDRRSSAVEQLISCSPATRFVNLAPSTEHQENEIADAELIGGSFAELSRLHLIRKEAVGEGKEKLIREISWLSALPTELAIHFPTVVAHHYDESKAWFEMPWYKQPSLRRQILLDSTSSDRVASALEVILDFMAAKVYTTNRRGVKVNEGLDWIDEHHFSRFFVRLDALRGSAPDVSSLLEAKSVIINDRKYPSLNAMVQEVQANSSLLKRLAPKFLGMVHGDLHFQNILVDLENEQGGFVLADPRGEVSFDYHYDLGKLWHSFNGLYDLIHTDRYLVEQVVRGRDTAEIRYQIGDANILANYKAINTALLQISEGGNLLFSEDNWLERAQFNEAMHFATVVPFHLRKDGKEERALVLVARATELFYEFLTQYA